MEKLFFKTDEDEMEEIKRKRGHAATKTCMPKVAMQKRFLPGLRERLHYRDQWYYWSCHKETLYLPTIAYLLTMKTVYLSSKFPKSL